MIETQTEMYAVSLFLCVVSACLMTLEERGQLGSFSVLAAFTLVFSAALLVKAFFLV